MNEIKLRKLKEKDAEFMLEWMHDVSVVEFLQIDFSSKTIDDCKKFIYNAANNVQNLHLAIVDNDDEYMGTVSLKHIKENSAEFAITVRKKAMKKGYAAEAMQHIIRIGVNELNLTNIYWCVSPKNIRAIKFYDKNMYTRIDKKDINFEVEYTQEQVEKYIWYKYEV